MAMLEHISRLFSYDEWANREVLSSLRLADLWKNYLTSLNEAGLADSINYKNTKGENFTSQKQDVLMHVIMHSAYHRGQIASDMRAAGFTPPYTDFIHAVRQGLL